MHTCACTQTHVNIHTDSNLEQAFCKLSGSHSLIGQTHVTCSPLGQSLEPKTRDAGWPHLCPWTLLQQPH